MTRDEYNLLFHTEQLNLVAFKRLMDCDEEVLRLVNKAIAQEREAWEHKFARLHQLMDIREIQPNKPCCLAARADEREACAALCFSIWNEWLDTPEEDRYKVLYDAEDCAAAIRARGTT
jgi:hypothetical protein